MTMPAPSLLRETLYRSSKLVVRRSSRHRWGVFALEPIDAYELLEEAPYAVVPREQIDAAPVCEVYSYSFDDESVVIGFGFAGLYNHAAEPNSSYELDRINEVMRHYATRAIGAGEELTLDYGAENVERYGLSG